MNRRKFVNTTTIGAGAAFITGLNACANTPEKSDQKMTDQRVTSMVESIAPISVDEIQSRIRKAQQLMQDQKIGALLLDAGTSLKYFTGLSWWPSERPMVTIIPANGEISYVCPAFEEPRVKEIMKVGSKIYSWEEDENPYAQVVLALKDAGVSAGKVGIEERTRFFIFNGIEKAGPNLELVSGDSITIPCRIIKSASEIALMQKATEITIRAIQIGLSSLEVGSNPSVFSNAVAKAHADMGAYHEFALANFAEASAFPHGSTQPQTLKEGDVVLVDCGCAVEGYQSDISRTIVFGAAPTKRQQEIWDLEKKAQAAGFAAAQLGKPLGNIDAAARKVLTDAGFGPGYKLPGLPHRTGHGIGMDGHEWGNALKGNERLLEPGMCFSIEPNISIVGEFGVRLEDCVHMTSEGPEWFSQPSPSIDKPFLE
ncbi:Xaa-Pro dipeptidase [Pricia antarctica]|uniref:Xaa-Pro dipeptidase n=1 Tax=Pricia antarctica TaxID=641691 RepID=A0A1G6YYA7_9FLAO|nr:Xaa-Pro peptidase family protein [Pricia antarctica]SDD94625.1 Xaa-Pro dipeptidase [Pricia antarctica]